MKPADQQDEPVQKTPTATDVAKRAGVSRTQVSYVLNNKRLAHVSEINRKKILDAASELGYQPHSSAQVLRRGYSKEFSIFFPAPYPPIIHSVIAKIHEKGLIQGFAPIQYSFNSYENEERMYDALHVMLNRKPYGVFCSFYDLARKEVDYMISRGVKKILVWDIEKHDDIPTMLVPVETVGKIAARHFCDRNYQDIGFLKPADPVQKNAFPAKLKGFREGWNTEIPLCLEVLNWPSESYRPTMYAARLFLDQLMEKGHVPRAIYAYSDNYALPLISVLQEKGFRIPQDVAVLGTDNIIYTEMSKPKLSTIQFDSTELGLRVVAKMNQLISGKEIDEKYSLPPQPALVEREST